jgi:hypothetical protein
MRLLPVSHVTSHSHQTITRLVIIRTSQAFMLAPACNNCNLQLKPRHVSAQSKEGSHQNFFIPVVFHNLKNYDAHHIIKYFKLFANEPGKNKNGKQKKYRDIEIIALNSERYISFEFNGFRFLDSFQFLPSSLDKLVSNLALDGHEKFVSLRRWLSDSPLLVSKGVFPYEYMTGPDKIRWRLNYPRKTSFTVD